MTDYNDFLMSGGTPTAKFEAVGDVWAGSIVRAEVQQQRDYTTGELLVWDDGRPRQQMAVTIATSARDDDTDDGNRTVYVKGQMLKAVRAAVRKAGASRMDIGGALTVTYTGNGEASKRGMNPPKLYEATYTPAPGAAVTELLNADQPDPAQPAAPASSGPSPEALAALAQLTPEQKAALGIPA